jgi:hypothetical protein
MLSDLELIMCSMQYAGLTIDNSIWGASCLSPVGDRGCQCSSMSFETLACEGRSLHVGVETLAEPFRK